MRGEGERGGGRGKSEQRKTAFKPPPSLPPSPKQPTGGYAFFMPPVSFMGPGALQAAGAHVRGLGLRKALIVTDAPLVAAGAVAAVTAMLDAVGVAHAVYAGVEPNPTVGQVEAGLAVLREAGCDCVVSCGGGTPHDAAKGIAAVATSGGERKEGRGWGAGVGKVEREGRGGGG